jgi:hypothetical protein
VVCRAVSCLMPKRFRMSGMSEKGVTSPLVSAPTGSPALLMALAGGRAAPWPWRPKHSGSSAPEEVGLPVDSLDSLAPAARLIAITNYAFSQTELRKSGPFGAV